MEKKQNLDVELAKVGLKLVENFYYNVDDCLLVAIACLFKYLQSSINIWKKMCVLFARLFKCWHIQSLMS
jgi:hypothetical protein